jgi:hypothetical protein
MLRRMNMCQTTRRHILIESDCLIIMPSAPFSIDTNVTRIDIDVECIVVD